MKKIIGLIGIPIFILVVNEFEFTAFFMVGIYLLIYWIFFSDTNPSTKHNPKHSTQPYSVNKQREVEAKRKEGYQKWLEKKREDKSILNSEHKSNAISKFSLSQKEFEEEINSQLNQYRGSFTKIFWVGDEHRLHPWSKEPGGCTIVVLFKNQSCLGYDKVKRPDRYTQKIARDHISNHYSNAHLHSLELYINEIYLTSEKGVDLKKVWHSNMHQSPWSILEKYRIK